MQKKLKTKNNYELYFNMVELRVYTTKNDLVVVLFN